MQVTQVVLDFSKKTSAYYEATSLGLALELGNANNILLASGSSPHAGMRTDELFITLIALAQLNIDKTVIVETSNAGLATEHQGLPWSPITPPDGASVSSNWLSDEVYKRKKKFIWDIYLKIEPFLGREARNPNTLRVLQIENTCNDFKFQSIVHPALEGKMVGLWYEMGLMVPIRQRDAQIATDKGEVIDGSSIREAIKQNGFQFGMASVAQLGSLTHARNTVLAFRDYSDARGIAQKLSQIWQIGTIAMTSRLYTDFSLQEVVLMAQKKPAQLAQIIQTIPLVSSGNEWHIKK